MDEAWLVILVAAFSVFPLWLVEQFLPGPVLIEEVTKLLLVLYIAKKIKQEKGLILAVISGLVFGMSETILYLFNAFTVGSFELIRLRILTTLPMHLLTFCLIYWGVGRGRVSGVIGFGAAIAIHYLFNLRLA